MSCNDQLFIELITSDYRTLLRVTDPRAAKVAHPQSKSAGVNESHRRQRGTESYMTLITPQATRGPALPGVVVGDCWVFKSSSFA